MVAETWMEKMITKLTLRGIAYLEILVHYLVDDRAGGVEPISPCQGPYHCTNPPSHV